MPLLGKHFIGDQRTASGDQTFSAKAATTGETLAPEFSEATPAEVDQCLQQAEAAFDALRTASNEKIASLLEAIADGIESADDALLPRAHAETALPMARLTAEQGRTVNQTRMFAALVREGSWVQARIDVGDAARKPLPKPDVRTMLRGIGPVVVFGASNFPLAISVAGTDTVSALAARCPVVVKAHPGHPGTCELIAEIIATAVAESDLPAGVFNMLQGAGNDVGQALVKHPLTAAVAFTGSLQGGRALFDAAASRPNPIPCYAEMGSINPLFLLPGRLNERTQEIAAGYVQSVAMGCGQFCTNPGLVFAAADNGLDQFLEATAAAAHATPCATMLHSGIHAAFEAGVARISATPGVESLAKSTEKAGLNQAACTIFAIDADLFSEQPELTEEVFGPVSLLVRCKRTEQMLDFARQLEGQLTATVHGTEQDLLEHNELIRMLERKVGRIVFNGFPTGIEVCAAMHHGGPYPATTHSGTTSIGQASIYRFAKPVCYQNFPNAALPVELR